jgi:hypothetical protein
MAVTDGGCGPHFRRYGLTIRDRPTFVLPTSGEKARGARFPLAELDRLDSEIVRQRRLVLPNLTDHRLGFSFSAPSHGKRSNEIVARPTPKGRSFRVRALDERSDGLNADIEATVSIARTSRCSRRNRQTKTADAEESRSALSAKPARARLPSSTESTRAAAPMTPF